jgi:hypothetical protein
MAVSYAFRRVWYREVDFHPQLSQTSLTKPRAFMCSSRVFSTLLACSFRSHPLPSSVPCKGLYRIQGPAAGFVKGVHLVPRYGPQIHNGYLRRRRRHSISCSRAEAHCTAPSAEPKPSPAMTPAAGPAGGTPWWCLRSRPVLPRRRGARVQPGSSFCSCSPYARRRSSVPSPGPWRATTTDSSENGAKPPGGSHSQRQGPA